nr:hypothetical protein [Corallococcus coralloides]
MVTSTGTGAPSGAYTGRWLRSDGPRATHAPPAPSTAHSAASFSGDVRRHTATGVPAFTPRAFNFAARASARAPSSAQVQCVSPWDRAVASAWRARRSASAVGTGTSPGVARGVGQARRSSSVASGRCATCVSGFASAAPSSTWKCSMSRAVVAASNRSDAYSSAPWTRLGDSKRTRVSALRVEPHCTGVPGTSTNVARRPMSSSVSDELAPVW